MSDHIVHQRGSNNEPINAEPDPEQLTSSFITPQSHLYLRNHGDILHEDASAASDWQVTIAVDNPVRTLWQRQRHAAKVSQETTLTLSHLKKMWPTMSVVAAMECAGNRRKDMSQAGSEAKPEGLQWNQAAIANSEWYGASLREVLLSLNIPDPYGHLPKDKASKLPPSEKSIQQDSAEWSRDLFVQFISSQQLEEAHDKPAAQDAFYGSSISLATALHPNSDVLLSYSVNSKKEALQSTHGYPLRVVIPGHLGARWTKWLKCIRISQRPNRSEPMVEDYKHLTPPNAGEEAREGWAESMMGDDKNEQLREQEMKKSPPMMRLGIGSGVSSPEDGDEVKLHRGQDEDSLYARVEGYAVGSEGSPVSLVEITLVEHKADDDDHAIRTKAKDYATWMALDSSGAQTNANSLRGHLEKDTDEDHRPVWSWTLWHADVPVDPKRYQRQCSIVVRASASSGTQQEMQSEWNVRGFKERSWPVVRNVRFVQPTNA